MLLSRVLNLNLGKKERKNRHRLEIVRDMLSIVSVKVRKTRIMYQANLSFPLTEKYLKSLVERGLVKCDVDSCYFITERGKEFLQMYADYLDRCRRIGEDISGVRKDRLLLENICFNNDFNCKQASNRREVLVQY